MSDRNLAGIQYLRGFAAGAVVLYHASRVSVTGQPEAGDLPLEALGTFAVQLFFVISGFIITIVSLDQEGQPKLGVRAFAARRFARIVPFMWLCTLAYNALAFAGGAGFDAGELVRSLALWPAGNLKPGLLWTLRLELIFYLVFGLTLLVSRSRWWLLAAWASLPVLVRIAGVWGAPEGGDHPIWIAAMGHQAGANIQFGLGVLLGHCWLKAKQWPQLLAAFGFPALLGLGIVAAGLSEALFGVMRETSAIVLNSLICLTLVATSLLVGQERTWADHVGRQLGDASYAIYLTHVFPLLVIGKLAGSELAAYNAFVVCGALTVIAVSFGCMVHWFVEARVVRLFNRLLLGRR